jgi:hypothetical protein
MRRTSMKRTLARGARYGLVALACSVMPACILFAPSEEDVKNDFAVIVDAANHCDAAEQCTSVSAGCPLPCFVGVRKDRAAEVERKGKELVEDFESGGRSCDYDCSVPGTPTCKNGRCAFTDP